MLVLYFFKGLVNAVVNLYNQGDKKGVHGQVFDFKLIENPILLKDCQKIDFEVFP